MFKSIKRKAAVCAAVVGGFLASAASHAALPAGVATMMTSITTDFGDLLDLAYPVMIAIVGGMVIFRLVKSVAKSAASG